MKRRIVVSIMSAWVLCLSTVGLLGAAQGDLLWEKIIDPPAGYTSTGLTAFVTSPTSLIFSGWFYKEDPQSQFGFTQIGFIKAFDVVDGRLKWEKTLDTGFFNSYVSIVVAGENVVVYGFYRSESIGAYHGILRGYNADTGQLAFDKEVVGYDSALVLEGPLSLIAANNRVFVLQGIRNTNKLLVQAYQACNVSLTGQSLLLLD